MEKETKENATVAPESGAQSGEESKFGHSGRAGRKIFFRRRKSCPLTGSKAPKIDYKDLRLMNRFISERGQILPSRITAVSTSKQRALSNAIKRARFLALIPYVVK